MVGTVIGMTNPEYENPGIIRTDEDKQEAYDRQQEVAARTPMDAVPDIVTNAEAEKAAAEAREQVVAGNKGKAAGAAPAKRTTPKAGAST